MTSFNADNLALLAADVPEWRSTQMKSALKSFDELSEPTGIEEDWRYIEYDMPFSELQPVFEPGARLAPGPFLSAVGATSGSVVVVDGHVVEVKAEGLNVFRPNDLDETSAWSVSVPPDHNKLAAAHAAFSHDGVVVDVPPNALIEDPLVIDIQGVTADSASFPHLEIRLGENSEANILVLYRSGEGKRLLMVPEVDLHVGDSARLKFLAVQSLDHAASVVVHQRIHLGRDSSSRIGEVGLGGNLGRLDLGVDLNGDGASSEVVGIYFGERDQTLDYRMLIDHHGRRTSSDVFLKGAVEDDAQSVFTGLLRIEKDATRTSTFETNRNLVLSDNAKAQSVPNLEILCDDVVCGHASSVGPLEEDHLYYLQSRGLGKERAERLLIRGFFQEVIDRLPLANVAGPVSDEVFRRFVTAQEEGRVS